MLQRREGVISATVGDDLVLLNPDSEVFFSLNETAARIWELLAEPRTQEDLVETLREEYDVSESQCQTAVSTFLAQAREHGVLQST
jgi:Coenzyme PQQ synthesis protein D (PqqD)